MALRGYAAFHKKVNAAPPGTFTIFDVRHGSKPWTLAAIQKDLSMQRLITTFLLYSILTCSFGQTQKKSFNIPVNTI
jgi:hypothetical protein